MRISDWSSDVCSSDLTRNMGQVLGPELDKPARFVMPWTVDGGATGGTGQAIRIANSLNIPVLNLQRPAIRAAVLKELGIERERDIAQERSNPVEIARNAARQRASASQRSEEHTSELQSLMRISYAVFCLKKKNEYTQKTLTL